MQKAPFNTTMMAATMLVVTVMMTVKKIMTMRMMMTTATSVHTKCILSLVYCCAGYMSRGQSLASWLLHVTYIFSCDGTVSQSSGIHCSVGESEVPLDAAQKPTERRKQLRS